MPIYVRLGSRARKTSLRGHGSFVGGMANDIPPPPERPPDGGGLLFMALGKNSHGWERNPAAVAKTQRFIP